MNNAFDTLPWWLAAVATVLVGGVSAVAAQGDVWVILARSGIAFVIFWIVGSVVKLFLTHSTQNPKRTTIKTKKSAVSNPEISEPSDLGAQNEAATPGEE